MQKATSHISLTTYILNPEKQNQTYPWKPSYKLTQKRSLSTSQKQLKPGLQKLSGFNPLIHLLTPASTYASGFC